MSHFLLENFILTRKLCFKIFIGNVCLLSFIRKKWKYLKWKKKDKEKNVDNDKQNFTQEPFYRFTVKHSGKEVRKELSKKTN